MKMAMKALMGHIPTSNLRYESHLEPVLTSTTRAIITATQAACLMSGEREIVTEASLTSSFTKYRETQAIVKGLEALPRPTQAPLLLPTKTVEMVARP